MLSLVASSLMKTEEMNDASESELKIENKHKALASGISFMGNQEVASLLGEFIIKQNPNPVINVPTRKK